MVLAVVMVQAIFATIHIPMLMVAGHGWAEVVAILPHFSSWAWHWQLSI
jgi:hypothetical protein